MSKLTLEFNLPEDRPEAMLALQGSCWLGVVHELDIWLRDQVKHRELPEDTSKAYDTVRSRLREFMEDSNLLFE